MAGTTSYPSIHSTPPWQFRTVIAAFILGFLIGPAAMVYLISLFYPHDPWVKNLLATLGSYGVWLIIFWNLRLQYGSGVFRYMGLIKNHRWSYYWFMGIVFGLVILMLGVMVGLFSPDQTGQVEQPFSSLPRRDLKWVALMAVMLAPIMEELIFRGFLQTTLTKYLPPFLAIILTAVIFTGFHVFYYGNWSALLYVGCLGLILGTVRYHTHSVIPGMIGHFLNNLIAASTLAASILSVG